MYIEFSMGLYRLGYQIYIWGLFCFYRDIWGGCGRDIGDYIFFLYYYIYILSLLQVEICI